MNDDRLNYIVSSKSKAGLERIMKLRGRRSVIVFSLQDHNKVSKDRAKEEEKKTIDILETDMTKITIEIERTRQMGLYCKGGIGRPLKGI